VIKNCAGLLVYFPCLLHGWHLNIKPASKRKPASELSVTRSGNERASWWSWSWRRRFEDRLLVCWTVLEKLKEELELEEDLKEDLEEELELELELDGLRSSYHHRQHLYHHLHPHHHQHHHRPSSMVAPAPLQWTPIHGRVIHASG
jgi:hypothetical protein